MCHNKLPCFQEAGQVDFESSFCVLFLQVTLYIALAFLPVTAEAPF